MVLLVAGNKIVRDVEQHGALAVRVPPEGGFEGRFRRRIRTAGYECVHMSARGLGDLSAYLLDIHGVRPPHLGKKSKDAAVGYRYFLPPVVSYRLEHLPAENKGLLLWLLEGYVLTNQELEFLVSLPQIEPRVKVVVELGGDRAFKWFPLKDALAAA
ncbi:NAD(P)H-quinone oxidoreductase subunit N [Romeria aff. gracilis LEGE 07310]|uniref:NAD(P)H-quinone oxidoreductase subunit N n=1 Tax=Vasconcelosia minhoensis LEGE 07310 TaxID=915328 RepID=A0A8J7DBE5_9CYAN|nr:NAD(P)H-quinone oxidoreductase subunit N [Romeria gracilis]MBE9077632.1 NAD(P)H-quinone oxidoreductase subunit N [Romeria aff. gracilis LEGE 07310]